MSFEQKFVTGGVLQQVAQGVRDKIKGEIVDNLESTDINKPLSANQGKILQDTKLGKNEKHEQTSDTITSMTGYEKAGTGVVLPTDSLNQAIGKLEVKADKVLDVANNAVSKDNIVNDLTTGGTDNVLSAEQGKVLKQLISSVSGDGGAGDGLIENAKSFNKIVYNGTLTTNGKDIVVGKTLYNPSLYLDGTRIDASEYELNAKVGHITLKQPYAKYEVSWEVEDQLPNHIRFSYPTLDLLIDDEPIKSIINIGDVIEIQGASDADDGGHKLVKCEDSYKLNGVQIGEGKYLNEIPNTNQQDLRELAQKALDLSGRQDGVFPLTEAIKDGIYYCKPNNKHYICIKEYSGISISVPNSHFEELSVWKNNKDKDSYLKKGNIQGREYGFKDILSNSLSGSFYTSNMKYPGLPVNPNYGNLFVSFQFNVCQCFLSGDLWGEQEYLYYLATVVPEKQEITDDYLKELEKKWCKIPLLPI